MTISAKPMRPRPVVLHPVEPRDAVEPRQMRRYRTMMDFSWKTENCPAIVSPGSRDICTIPVRQESAPDIFWPAAAVAAAALDGATRSSSSSKAPAYWPSNKVAQPAQQSQWHQTVAWPTVAGCANRRQYHPDLSGSQPTAYKAELRCLQRKLPRVLLARLGSSTGNSSAPRKQHLQGLAGRTPYGSAGDQSQVTASKLATVGDAADRGEEQLQQRLNALQDMFTQSSAANGRDRFSFAAASPRALALAKRPLAEVAPRVEAISKPRRPFEVVRLGERLHGAEALPEQAHWRAAAENSGANRPAQNKKQPHIPSVGLREQSRQDLAQLTRSGTLGRTSSSLTGSSDTAARSVPAAARKQASAKALPLRDGASSRSKAEEDVDSLAAVNEAPPEAKASADNDDRGHLLATSEASPAASLPASPSHANGAQILQADDAASSFGQAANPRDNDDAAEEAKSDADDEEQVAGNAGAAQGGVPQEDDADQDEDEYEDDDAGFDSDNEKDSPQRDDLQSAGDDHDDFDESAEEQERDRLHSGGDDEDGFDEGDNAPTQPAAEQSQDYDDFEKASPQSSPKKENKRPGHGDDFDDDARSDGFEKSREGLGSAGNESELFEAEDEDYSDAASEAGPGDGPAGKTANSTPEKGDHKEEEEKYESSEFEPEEASPKAKTRAKVKPTASNDSFDEDGFEEDDDFEEDDG